MPLPSHVSSRGKFTISLHSRVMLCVLIFHRKLFARSEFSQSLKELGLVPSAVGVLLIVKVSDDGTECVLFGRS